MTTRFKRAKKRRFSYKPRHPRPVPIAPDRLRRILNDIQLIDTKPEATAFFALRDYLSLLTHNERRELMALYYCGRDCLTNIKAARKAADHVSPESLLDHLSGKRVIPAMVTKAIAKLGRNYDHINHAHAVALASSQRGAQANQDGYHETQS